MSKEMFSPGVYTSGNRSMEQRSTEQRSTEQRSTEQRSMELRSMEGCVDMDVGNTIPDDIPLAMAYVRMQRLDKMYPPEAALQRGTLFPDLDKPFCGLTVMGGGCHA